RAAPRPRPPRRGPRLVRHLPGPPGLRSRLPRRGASPAGADLRGTRRFTRRGAAPRALAIDPRPRRRSRGASRGRYLETPSGLLLHEAVAHAAHPHPDRLPPLLKTAQTPTPRHGEVYRTRHDKGRGEPRRE